MGFVYLVKQTCKQNNLHIRTGPSTSYAIVGKIAMGKTFEVDDISKKSDGEYWYRHKANHGHWSCGYRPSVNSYKYLTVIEDRTPKPAPPPPPPAPPPPPPPSIDMDGIDNALNGNQGNLSDYDIDYEKAIGGTSATCVQGKPNLNYDAEVGSTDLYMNYNFVKSAIDTVKFNINGNYFKTFTELNMKLFQRINRWRINFPDYNLVKSQTYIFFTRPDCNLCDGDNLASQVKGDPFYEYLWANNRSIIRVLTQDFHTKHDFNLFLSNTAQSIDIPDEVIKTEEVGQNFLGYKVVYGKNNHESLTAGTFSVHYTDDRRLNVLKLHKAWVEYISLCFKGALSPKLKYKQQRVLDYACSVYTIVVGEDGETILYGHKYVGVFPTNVPTSILSWAIKSPMFIPEYEVQYAYSFRESINMVNIAELNKNNRSDRKGSEVYEKPRDSSGNKKNSEMNVFGGTSTTWVGAPFITADPNPEAKGDYVFKLRFSEV